MKKILSVILLFIFGLNFSACYSSNNNQVNNNDWSYALPNDYEIWHINSREIVCGKKNTENSILYVVSKYITEFCYNDSFVCLKRVDVPENIYQEIDMTAPDYYIVDTVENETYGPFDKEQYQRKIDKLTITGLSSWIKTTPRPNEASFS